jgi:fluoride ion exporter CrcB/FEX
MFNKGGYLWLMIGLILVLMGIGGLSRYLIDYSVLSPYGKGYVWGNLLLMVVGLSLCYLFYRARKSR